MRKFFADHKAKTGLAYTTRYAEKRKAASKLYKQRNRLRYRTNVCKVCGSPARTDAEFCSRRCAGDGRRILFPHSKIRVVDCPDCGADKVVSRTSPGHRCFSCAEVERPRFQAGWCRRCGDSFVMLFNNVDAGYCSAQCARSDSKDRRRARKREAFAEPVFRRKIFERDRWRCQICGKAVKRTKEPPHPFAPTIDHIIPLNDGGTHEPANVQCAHFVCNCRKSDGAANDQLRLIG